MSDYVKITKQGFVGYDWDSEAKDYRPTLKKASALSKLRSRVMLDDGLTLGDVLTAVQQDVVLTEFIAEYSWCSAIHEFHQQARLPHIPEDDGDSEPLVGVGVKAIAEFYDADGTIPAIFEGVYFDFYGIGSKGTQFSVSCTPLNQLVHLPITIDPKICVTRNYETTTKAEYSLSLLELLDAIYYDISFYGGPQQTEEFSERLKAMYKEFQAEFDQPKDDSTVV